MTEISGVGGEEPENKVFLSYDPVLQDLEVLGFSQAHCLSVRILGARILAEDSVLRQENPRRPSGTGCLAPS